MCDANVKSFAGVQCVCTEKENVPIDCVHRSFSTIGKSFNTHSTIFIESPREGGSGTFVSLCIFHVCHPHHEISTKQELLIRIAVLQRTSIRQDVLSSELRAPLNRMNLNLSVSPEGEF